MVCNCYEKYGQRKEENKTMSEEKVLVYKYAEPTSETSQIRGMYEMISKAEIENFLRSEKLKRKDICKGRIKMICSDNGKDNLINKNTGEVFRGTVMFVGCDRENIVNLTENQIRAIKCVYRKAE